MKVLSALLNIGRRQHRHVDDAAILQVLELVLCYAPQYDASACRRIIHKVLAYEDFPSLFLSDREKALFASHLRDMSQSSDLVPELFDEYISRMKHHGQIDLMHACEASDLLESGHAYAFVRDVLGVIALIWNFKTSRASGSAVPVPTPA